MPVKDVRDMKTLIISPHADDELGCFSFLKNSEVFVVSINESSVFSKRPHYKKRKDEMISFSKFVGAQYYSPFPEIQVNRFYNYKYELIYAVEYMIKTTKPELILIPHPSINQDHQTVYEACMVALRPHDKNHFVKKVLMYECPQSYIWGEPLTPNYFKEVDIKKKIKAYKLYKSQVRSYRSPELLKRMAEHRGKQANLKYAEGFKVVRWVNAKKRS